MIREKDEGMVIIIVIMIMFIFVVLGTALQGVWSADIAQTRIKGKTLQAHYLARSGAETVACYFENNPEHLGNQELKNKLDAIIGAGESSDAEALGVGEVTVQMRRQSNDGYDSRYIEIISTATVDPISRKATLIIKETPHILMVDEDTTEIYYTWERERWVFDPPEI